jgi:hypothetical protein
MAKREASPGVPERVYETEVVGDPDGSKMTALDVPFDAKMVFGKARAAVVVRIEKIGRGARGGYVYRSTVCVMGGERFVPLRTSHREAAGVSAGERVRVTLTRDDEPRVVAVPKDLAAALRKAGATAAWKRLSFTHQREHVEAILGAKKVETRARRVEACVKMVSVRGTKK